MADTLEDKDELRRRAITAWWERQSLNDFIRRVRSSRASKGSNNVR